MSRRLTYEYVKSKFEEEGYELLNTEYINNHTKMLCKCSKEHEQYKTLQSIVDKQGCKICLGKKYTHSQVKVIFNSKGCELLSEIYIDNRTSLDYICKNGHIHKIRLDDFLKDRGCPYCLGRYPKSLEEIRKEIAISGEKLLSNSYEDSKTYIKIECINGHVYDIVYNSYQQGHRCRYCQYINLSGSNNPNWQGGNKDYCPIWSDKGYKADIRGRDNNICQNPYCFKLVKDMTIHHIGYDKYNCHPSNLITVCRSCNARANTDRDWHKDWYQSIMIKKYKYNY